MTSVSIFSILFMCPLYNGLYAQSQNTSSHAVFQDTLISSEYWRSAFLYTSLSSTYSTSTNWQGQDTRVFSLVGNIQYRHGGFGDGRNHAHQINADLGYLKFVDSIWVKSVDRLQVNLLWGSDSPRVRHSYSLLLATQFLPSTNWRYDQEEERMKEEKIGGFMNPFNLEFGYGAVVTFWSTSNINFAFATLKLSGHPKENTAAPFSDATFLETEKMNYYMHYGLGVITAINKPIGKHLQWLNNSRMFLNGIDKDHVNFDFSNMLIAKIWKYLQVRFDTRLAYNPILNYKLQFRQEVLVGFFYERSK